MLYQMQKHSIRQRIQRKEKWCHKMEKKLAVIVDNKEVTTEITNTEMCSSACDVVMETCSSQNHDACGDCVSLEQPKTRCSCENSCGNGRIKEGERRKIVNGYS